MLLVFSSVIRSEIEGSEPALSILEGRSYAPSFPFLCHPRTKREPALSPLEGNPESSTLVFERVDSYLARYFTGEAADRLSGRR